MDDDCEAVSRQRTLAHLPPELIGVIASHLPRPTDRLALAGTCRTARKYFSSAEFENACFVYGIGRSLTSKSTGWLRILKAVVAHSGTCQIATCLETGLWPISQRPHTILNFEEIEAQASEWSIYSHAYELRSTWRWSQAQPVNPHPQPGPRPTIPDLHPILIRFGGVRLNHFVQGRISALPRHSDCRHSDECESMVGLNGNGSCLLNLADHAVMEHSFATSPPVMELGIAINGSSISNIAKPIQLGQTIVNVDGVTVSDVRKALAALLRRKVSQRMKDEVGYSDAPTKKRKKVGAHPDKLTYADLLGWHQRQRRSCTCVPYHELLRDGGMWTGALHFGPSGLFISLVPTGGH